MRPLKVARVRVAMIDSGVNSVHPHVQPIAGGVHISEAGEDDDYVDLLGHGTAVAGVIRDKAPDAELYAIKVFDQQLATSGPILLRALDWCVERRMDFINLSLGTINEHHVPGFEERIARALRLGSTIVAAFEMNGQRAFPGSLDGVAGVLLDNTCSRDEFREHRMHGRSVYAAAGFPRDIPGVPPSRNLQGISFAVANVTGFLAAHAAQCLRK